MAEFTIRLENVRIYAYHGVYRQEQEVGNEFIVNVSVTIPDNYKNNLPFTLTDTISYADIYQIIKEEMDSPQQLLETVVQNIKRNLVDKWPHIITGNIKIVKVSPPIPGMSGQASVTYKW